MRNPCKTCAHFGRHPDEPTRPGAYACLIRPPSAIGIPMQGQIAGQMGLMIKSVYTPLAADAPGCGEWKESEEAKIGLIPEAFKERNNGGA